MWKVDANDEIRRKAFMKAYVGHTITRNWEA